MRIQHNIPAMSAYRNYTNNVSAMKKNLEKLSSGYKINRAGDDAAGLAISEKMRAQITGLQVAQKNAKDGISLVQTAEGALTEVHDMLNRMYSLAEQSANGTYDNEVDRVQLQKEIDSLSTEINRIADSANFNGIKLLNGNQGAKSLSALGETPTVVDGSAINGTNPSAAGAAEITVDLRSAAAVNGEVLKSNTDNDVDGSDLAPATKAQFTITVGGVALKTGEADTNGKIKITGGKLDTDGTPADITAGSTTIDMTKWGTGDYIEFTAGGKAYKFSNGAKDGYVDVTAGGSSLDAELTKIGLTLNNPAANNADITATAVGAITLDTGHTITAGTTTYAGLKNLEAGGKKLSDLFTIKVNGTTVDAQTDTIKAGDVITLEAKQAGAMDEAANKTYAKLSGATGGAVAGATGLDTKVEATNGKDVDYASPAVTPTKYDITIDTAKLQGGQEIRIGEYKIKFTAGSTATTSVFGTKVNDADDPDNGYQVATVNLNDADVAGGINTLLGKIFGTGNTNGFDATKVASTTTGTKLNYKAQSTLTATDINKANMGEVRVFEANKDGETEITAANKAVTSKYEPAKEPAAGADNAPFAKVEYTIEKDMVKAGNKLTIGGKEIEFVADGDEDLAKGKVGVGNVATNLAKALEQQGYTSGKVTVAADGNDFTLTIEGTQVGQTAADLKADAGKVTFLDKAKAGPNVVTTDDGTFKIEVGKTKVSDLLETELVAAGTNPAKTLGDLFRITDANGRELKADSVITDGQTIKFVAKDKGKLDSDIMDKLAFNTGEANITIKNGWDEGTAASGDKTHYELQFNLNNLRGGQTFTFGTDTSSVTFELTFDDVETDNGTINDKDNTNLNGGSNHVQIDLGGLTTDAEKIKAIVDAVSDEMDKFDVSYSATAGKMTLMMDGKAEWNAQSNDTNLGNVRVSTNNSALSSTVYNPAGGAAAGTPGTYAQIAYEFDVSKLQEGDALTVGDTTVYFGKEASVEKDGNGSKITVSLEDAKSDTNLITQALESAGYRGGKVEFGTNKVTITGVETGETADHLKGNLGKITLGTTTNRAMSEGGLKLQIGDTADPYNQMVVDIKDCRTSAMGLDGLNIGSQDNALDAMAKIKNAINYVSDIRGGLGATQNRLDHTINNLSVMQENIQDAESSIRDVDVAEEMMAYTKNNILIQSAQAMLAQANQMPQGVLQLLG